MRTKGFKCHECGKMHIGLGAFRRAKLHKWLTKGHQATWWGISTDKGRRFVTRYLESK